MPIRPTIALAALALALAAPLAARAESQPPGVGIHRCLANWKTHPFGAGPANYRVIESKVGVFGIGGDIRDDQVTDKPELIYVRPNVSVMSKSVLELMNPNGWYCIERSVAVMAKIEVRLHCKAHLASTEEGVSVMGGGDGGVNVMGATQVKSVGCDSPTY
jgi:hypothetical protein